MIYSCIYVQLCIPMKKTPDKSTSEYIDGMSLPCIYIYIYTHDIIIYTYTYIWMNMCELPNFPLQDHQIITTPSRIIADHFPGFCSTMVLLVTLISPHDLEWDMDYFLPYVLPCFTQVTDPLGGSKKTGAARQLSSSKSWSWLSNLWWLWWSQI